MYVTVPICAVYLCHTHFPAYLLLSPFSVFIILWFFSIYCLGSFLLSCPIMFCLFSVLAFSLPGSLFPENKDTDFVRGSLFHFQKQRATLIPSPFNHGLHFCLHFFELYVGIQRILYYRIIYIRC